MIIKAIKKINSNAVVTLRGNDINTCEIEWHKHIKAVKDANTKG